MRHYRVRWRFLGETEQITVVLANDRRHAEEMIWLFHVEPSQLRKTIKFVSIEPEEAESD